MDFFRFEELEKSFSLQLLFQNISFSFPQVGFISLLGNSGSGKTTLFYLLTGLERKDKGQIFYQGKELKTENDFRLFRKDCSFVFQEYGVLNYLSGYENLNLGGYDYEKISLIEKEKLNKKVGLLSGGEKQRLALLRTINMNSKIIFCDEPTGSLDEKNGILIMEELKKLSKDRLIIMVSHNKELVEKYSDIILSLENKSLKLIKTNKKLYSKTNNLKAKKPNLANNINISFKSFLQDKLKLLFTFISLILAFASILLVLNLKDSAHETIVNATHTFADYKRLKVCEIENNKIEGTSFSLSKMKRPKLNQIKEKIENLADIEYNLDYFLSLAKINYRKENINMNILSFPFGSGLEDLRINQQAKKIFQNLEEPIEIDIRQEVYTKYKNKIYKDEVNLSLKCYVHEIYEEFNFLNYPCIFISHDALKNYMKGIELTSLSKSRNVFTSLYDRYSSFSEEDDAYTSYSFYVDVKNVENVEEVINKLEDMENISVESRAIQTQKSLNSSFHLIDILMTTFAFISLILVVALLYLMLLSSFQSRKKEFAIYHTLGLTFNDFLIFIVLPNFSLLTFSYFFSFIFYKLGGMYLNSLFFKFFECNIFTNKFFSYKNIILHLISLFIVSLLFSLWFAFKSQKLKVSEVIKSE